MGNRPGSSPGDRTNRKTPVLPVSFCFFGEWVGCALFQAVCDGRLPLLFLFADGTMNLYHRRADTPGEDMP